MLKTSHPLAFTLTAAACLSLSGGAGAQSVLYGQAHKDVYASNDGGYSDAISAYQNLRTDAANGSNAPQLGLQPGYGASVQTWGAVKSRYPDSANGLAPCADLLIQAIGQIRSIAPNFRGQIRNLSQDNATIQKVNQLIASADACSSAPRQQALSGRVTNTPAPVTYANVPGVWHPPLAPGQSPGQVTVPVPAPPGSAPGSAPGPGGVFVPMPRYGQVETPPPPPHRRPVLPVGQLSAGVSLHRIDTGAARGWISPPRAAKDAPYRIDPAGATAQNGWISDPTPKPPQPQKPKASNILIDVVKDLVPTN